MRSHPLLARLHPLCWAAAVLLASAPSPSGAEDFLWDPGVGLSDFDDPVSWFDSLTAPTVGDDATFGNSSSANFAVDGAVDSVTIDESVAFVFQANSGVRTLTLDDFFLEASSSLQLNDVGLVVSGTVLGMGVEDAKLELREQASVTGGVIEGVQVLMSDATALLDGVELQNSQVQRTENGAPSILDGVTIGPNVTLSGNSGTTLQLDGTTTFVGDAELTTSPSLTAVLNGPLEGAGDSHLITNFGELQTAPLTSPNISFDDSPGVSQSLTIDNVSGVIDIIPASSLVVGDGELVIQGGVIEGGGNLRAASAGADLVVDGAAVIDGVSVQVFNGASLSLGVGVTLQSADVEVRDGSTGDVPSGFTIGAGSSYRSTRGGVVAIGPTITNDGSLNAERATLRVVGDTTIDGVGTTTLTSAGVLGVAPRIELAGGGSLTVGADQTLLFNTPDDGYLYGTGSGGLTLTNDGLVQVGVNGRATVLLSDNAASPIPAATLQDFTLENRGELLLESDSRLTLQSDSSTASTPVTTVDNVGGVITLSPGAELVFDQPNFTSEVVLQGGLITGGGAARSSGGDLLINGAAVVDGATIAVEYGAALTLGPGVTLQAADIAIGQDSTYALQDGLVVDAGTTYRSYDSGELTVGPSLTNNGTVLADRALLRFVGDSAINGTGTTTVSGTVGPSGQAFQPRIEIAGGGSLTIGADQTLQFGEFGQQYVYGSGSGGVTLVNDGLVQLDQFATVTLLQSDTSFFAPDATLQDFTLVNNGEVMIGSSSRLVFHAEDVDGLTPVATTIDNRNGVISLEFSELRFEQSGFPTDVTLRGGQIVGSTTEPVTFEQVIVAEDSSLLLTDSPTLTNVLLQVQDDGTLSIDGDLTNDGVVRVDSGLLRFVNDSALNGTGTAELNSNSSLELSGGGSLTIGADQTLQFGEFGQQYVYGSGSGGVTLVNDGLVQLDQFATVTLLQSDTSFFAPDATLQDFTLVNNGEVMIGSSSRLVFHAEDVDGLTPVATTIDNRNGVISLEFSELRFEQSGFPTDVTLRGGQIVGSTTEPVTFEQVIVAEDSSLLLTDSPTLTNVLLQVRNDGTLSIDGSFTANANARFTGGRLNAVGGEWLGTGEVLFEEAGLFAPARIFSTTGGAIRFGAGQQVRITNGTTELSGATIAGSLANSAGSLTVESGGTLRVESAPAAIDDVALNVAGVLDAQAILTATVPIPVAAGGELRVDTGATVTAPSVTIDSGGVLTLAGGVLDTPSFVLGGSAAGSGTIVTPNSSATPAQIAAPITGTSAAEPITLTGWIEGDGLLDNVLFEGTHSPGDGTAFTTAGSLAYAPGSDLRIEITNQNVLNPGFDRLVSTGSVSLGGDLDLQLVDYVENTLSINDQLVLLTSDGLSGTFANVAPGDRVLFDGGLASAQIDYGPTSPFNPDHVVFSEFVREPQQIFWVGGSSNWNSVLNWDLLRVPNNDGSLKYHAIINAGTVDVDVPVTLSRLTLNNVGSTLTLNQTMTVEDFTWTAAHLGGTNALTITGQSTFDTTSQLNTGPGLINQGTATWVDGDFTGTFNQQYFVNQGEFVIELVDDHSFQYFRNTATGLIRHTGTARATLGANTGFENDGQVEITGGGTLRVGRDFDNGSDGDFVITDGVLESSVGFGADHKYNGSVTGEEFRALAGTTSFNGAYDVDTTEINSATTFNTPTPAVTDTLTINAGTVMVGTTLTVDQLTWNGGGFATAAGETVLTTSGVIDTPVGKTLTGRVVNQGALTWLDGGFSDNQNGVIQNEGTFSIGLATERSLRYVYNTATGVVRHTNGVRANVGVNGGFENDGQVEITGGGALRIGRDRTNGSDGDFVITDGVLESSVGFGADHKYNGSVTGEEFRALAGTTSFNGAYDVDTTEINSATTFNTPTPAVTDTLTLNAGEIKVETEFVADQINWTGGGFGTSTGQPVLTGQGVISGPDGKVIKSTLINQGALTWTDGALGSGAYTAARLRNEGLFTMDLVTPRSIVRLENPGGGEVQNTGAAATINWFANGGTLDVIASSVTVGGNFDNHSGTTLTGGEWIVRDGAAINLGARTITINNSAVRLHGPGSVLTAIDPLAENLGVFEIAEGRDFTTVGDLANSGAVVIGAGSTLTVSGVYTQTGAGSSLQVDGEFISPGGPATFAGGAELGGGGFVPGDVVIGVDGVVTPGSSPGTLTVESLQFGDDAVYEWEYDGTESDSIVASNSLTLGASATLRIVQLGGAPSLSDEFVLFEYPESQADPTNPAWTIDGSLAPDWDVSSATVTLDPIANQVLVSGLVTVLNPADFNADGLVDAADYTLWRDSLDQQVAPFTSADADGDGHVTQSDYLVWRTNYGATGVLASPAAVPEPGGLALSCLLCLSAQLRSRSSR
ncbi:hypothetical protein [Posidoniimonas corsicana]|uniref:hypothetical protein n=1 Tax=Posidoniimonas corsicana TaxID=1938618 RepID=UPI0011B4E4C8|nr:hypothetical protein [Posidoniimonas corsicana]